MKRLQNQHDLLEEWGLSEDAEREAELCHAQDKVQYKISSWPFVLLPYCTLSKAANQEDISK